MPTDATTSTLIGTAIGAFAGIAGTVLSTYFIQRSEERRQSRRLIMEMALENWKYLRSKAEQEAERAGFCIIPPLDTSVIHMAKLIEVCTHRRLTAREVKRILAEMQAVTDAASEQIHEYSKKSNPTKPPQ